MSDPRWEHCNGAPAIGTGDACQWCNGTGLQTEADKTHDRDLRRAHVIAAMEAAIGAGVATDDATADELLAACDRAGMPWVRVLLYIETWQPAEGYSVESFERYVKLLEDVHVIG